METYTGKQYARRWTVGCLGAFAYVAGAVVLARHGKYFLPGGEWIPAFIFVLTAIIGIRLLKWINDTLPLINSFLIDQYDRVVSYVHGDLFANAKQLEQRKWRVVRHVLESIIVDGVHQIAIAGGEGKTMVQSTVWVDVDLSRLQDYFDTFLKVSGSPTPKDRVRKLIDEFEFFREQDPVVFKTDSSGLAATIVGKQLAEWLKEDLKSSGLRVELVACVATD